jgi:hypothetical protein
MLITFRVANFLSFNEEEEFSMLAGKQRKPVRPAVPLATGVEALKLAVIYGANASGKSNLVRSIDFAKRVILYGLKEASSFEDHFRLKKGNQDLPTKFEFEFKIGEICYAYGFDIQLNTMTVLGEWLFEVKKTTQKAIFERVVDETGKSFLKNRPKKLNAEDENRFRVYEKDLQKYELILSVHGKKEWDENSFFSVFSSIFHWFDYQLIVLFPNTNINAYKFIETDTGDFSGRKFMSEMLRRFDTGIESVELIDEDSSYMLNEIPPNKRKNILATLERGELAASVHFGKRYLFSKNMTTQKITVSRIVTKHLSFDNGLSEEFDFEDESDGTKRLFDFIPILFSLANKDFVPTVIVDEFDRSLHPGLLFKLIEYFLLSTKDTQSQLIVTIHDSNILDLNLLRRDEIWFMEKNNHGESHVFSLEEFQPRFDKKIRKAYLLGRFGAIPFISDVEQLNWEITNAEG